MNSKYLAQEMFAKHNLPNTETTSKIIDELVEYFKTHPEIRFCQLISNLTRQYEDIFYVSDADFLSLMTDINKHDTTYD